MVIERFERAEAVAAVYRRFHWNGRMMPEGLDDVDSWIEAPLRAPANPVRAALTPLAPWGMRRRRSGSAPGLPGHAHS
jgi:Domain of unknown function (DUF3303)